MTSSWFWNRLYKIKCKNLHLSNRYTIQLKHKWRKIQNSNCNKQRIVRDVKA